jgi:A/G-specific adenine glycosylase
LNGNTNPPVSIALLSWYDGNARDLPWRTGPQRMQRSVHRNPYHVWLSEVMLQQTQVATVRRYFFSFIDRWPRIHELATAERDDVMRAWAGLGYYSRARNLKKCAEIIAFKHGGEFPRDVESLRALPGIGSYTSAAIAAIAFGRRVAVVDGNVERVVSRLFALTEPMPAAKPLIHELTGTLVPVGRPGDFAEAMMDLGATVCTPKRPACDRCPIGIFCAARAQGDAETFPRRNQSPRRPVRRGAVFVASNAECAVFLRKRPDSGLLGGMSEPPSTQWSARQDGETGSAAAPFLANWRLAGAVRHIFTHFQLELHVWSALDVATSPAIDGWWSSREALQGEALPSVMKKAIAVAIPNAFKSETGKGCE